MMLGVNILLYAVFVFVSEYSNKSSINPLAMSILFSICYLIFTLIFFQYFEFKKKTKDKYLTEYFVVFISMYIYGSRLEFDSISFLSMLVMFINILFGLVFLEKISSDCRRVPDIEKYTIGAFGEYPIKNKKALEKIKPLSLLQNYFMTINNQWVTPDTSP